MSWLEFGLALHRRKHLLVWLVSGLFQVCRLGKGSKTGLSFPVCVLGDFFRVNEFCHNQRALMKRCRQSEPLLWQHQKTPGRRYWPSLEVLGQLWMECSKWYRWDLNLQGPLLRSAQKKFSVFKARGRRESLKCPGGGGGGHKTKNKTGNWGWGFVG